MEMNKKEEKKAEYVERGNVLKTMCIGNEMDTFGNLTCEQKAIIMLIQENARLKEEIEELKRTK